MEHKCCKRDMDNDGNCDRHPEGWALDIERRITQLLEENKRLRIENAQQKLQIIQYQMEIQRDS